MWQDIDGNASREGLPAVIHGDGTVAYYTEGRLHRDDGKPAVIYPDGAVAFWEEGKRYKP
jgi:hypothetical protein